ncbi:MAG: response regulator [Burkholderiales bacterium]|nr:response regulator [Burkholderiales bacterium]
MSSARILVVEDDAKISSILVDYLRQASFTVETESNGALAVAKVRRSPPDCILLDLNLPGLEGIEVCKQVREFSVVPIAIITARIDEIDRLLGLELGADDYICKPFSPREVVARVKALLRRSAAPVPRDAANPAGLVLDSDRLRVQVDGTLVALTGVEFRLLEALHKANGRVLSRNQLIDGVHDDFRDVSDRSVDSHIRNVRRKLDANSRGHDWVRSVYGVGYAFNARDNAAT